MSKSSEFSTKSHAAWALIEASHRVTLLAHQKPDPDALGACGALALLLERHGKEVEIIYPGVGRDTLPYPLHNLRENHHRQAPDLLISCDSPDIKRLYFPIEFAGIAHINIDHHQNNTIQATLSFVDTACTSTAELVYRLCKEWQRAITPDMAHMLLFGVMCDTLNFKIPGTTSETLRIAADLIDHGANLAELNNALIIHTDPNVIALWGTLLSTATYDPDTKTLWTVCSDELLTDYNLTESALNGFIATFAHTITNDVTVLFYRQNGMSKASLRSKKTNVNAIAREFGGGGHILASGITSSLPLEELVNQVTTKLIS